MCGIGLILSSGVGGKKVVDGNPSLLDIVAPLRRRGPDSCRVCIVYAGEIDKLKPDKLGIQKNVNGICHDFSESNGSCEPVETAATTLQFIGTTLQLRGFLPVCQPLRDGDGNVLVYNGEVFDGLEVLPHENDTEVILSKLQECCSCTSASCLDHQGRKTIPQLLSQIRGPWAFVYWQASSRTLWFGRDVFGRRSLLVHWPTTDDSRFLLSSVAPVDGLSYDPFTYWEELPCGVYSVHVELGGSLLGMKETARANDWQEVVLNKLVAWDRSAVHPSGCPNTAEVALAALRRAVERRLVNCRVKQSSEGETSPVAVLFSGGIDSMILAALVDQCLDKTYAIDLLNVSFSGSTAPDRITAVSGVAELRRVSSARCWRLVQVDERLESHGKRIVSLICPSQTYMDSNIGIALWCAAGGRGTLYDANDKRSFKSEAKVVLVGAGADEQCGGYLRYRTKFKLGGWEALAEEMKLDMQRLWKRNLGRDDRCIADNGVEARFPFLDEDVIQTFLALPLQDVVDLREDVGVGDKKILRQVARLLGISQSSTLPKRAIQFGSGIAKQSNKRDFGSNRAANKASAGSVKLH